MKNFVAIVDNFEKTLEKCLKNFIKNLEVNSTSSREGLEKSRNWIICKSFKEISRKFQKNFSENLEEILDNFRGNNI